VISISASAGNTIHVHGHACAVVRYVGPGSRSTAQESVLFSHFLRVLVSLYQIPSLPLRQHMCCYQHKHTTICTWRTCDLLDRAREPLASPESPQAEGVGKNNTNGNRGVVERLRVDWVELWKAKYDGDKSDPEHGGDSDWV
jgi:hypothetical protein